MVVDVAVSSTDIGSISSVDETYSADSQDVLDDDGALQLIYRRCLIRRLFTAPKKVHIALICKPSLPVNDPSFKNLG
jgi:hypothetical protein